MARTRLQVEEFSQMLRTRTGEQLDAWLHSVADSGVPEVQRFADGLQADYAAVQAGLSVPWSQGQVEGQVHRLKLLKRQMYGRASFSLLRQRVLQRDPSEREQLGTVDLPSSGPTDRRDTQPNTTKTA